MQARVDLVRTLRRQIRRGDERLGQVAAIEFFFERTHVRYGDLPLLHLHRVYESAFSATLDVANHAASLVRGGGTLATHVVPQGETTPGNGEQRRRDR